MRIEVASENALIAYLSDESNEKVSAQVNQLNTNVRKALGSTLIDTVPSYASLLVIYDALETDHFAVASTIVSAAESMSNDDDAGASIVELPVYYNTESGPDLEQLAQNANLSVDEVIEIHSGTTYPVYAIGFAPGFAYLGGLDARIAAPRLATPRQKVPKGAVAIADQQTAVYPSESPGGWNLIGLCPIDMFNPDSEPHMPVTVGDRIKFKPISREEFIALGGEL